MHARLLFTLKGNAGPDDLRQAVDVIGGQSEHLLDLAAHFIRPRLRAENTCFELDIVLRVAVGVEHLGNMQGVRRRAAQNGRTKVF